MNVNTLLSHCSFDSLVSIVRDVVSRSNTDPDVSLILMSIGEQIGKRGEQVAFFTALKSVEPSREVVHLLTESIIAGARIAR